MQTHVERISNGRHRSPSWNSIAVLALALVLAACGGGGGGGTAPSGGGTGAGNPPTPPPPPAPSGRATLVVTVVDAFGVPVPAARVGHYPELAGGFGVEGQTNSEGTVTLDVPAGAGRVVATSIIFGRQETAVDLPRDARQELHLALLPEGSEASALLGAEVVPGSIAADGRSLELRIRLAGGGQIYPWSFKLDPCVPRVDGELAALGPACLDKGDGTDRSWQYVGEVAVGPVTQGGGDPVGPLLLLLDRSWYAGVLDAWEEHLFAAKTLVADLLDDHPVAVGAFAGDGGPSGTASPLMEKPVTYYPLENPGWITDRVVAFEALESLRGLAGGSPALAAAIESGIDFLLARTVASDRPAIVVLTAGGSEGCSLDNALGPDAASQCTAIRAAAERARQAGVALWLIGPGDSWYPPWTGALKAAGSLTSVARESRAAWSAASVPGWVYTAGRLTLASLDGAPWFREVRFRISSDEAGSFVPGAEIGGDLEFFDAGFGLWWQRLPFRATVPAAGP